MKLRRKLIIAILIAVAFTFMPLLNGQAYAAVKKPAAPVITSAKDISSYDDYNIISIKWKKAKNAKKYQVAIRSEKKKWVKLKVVKKSKANKRKYTKKNKYKVVAKGKKYIVYKYQYKYSIKDETTKKSCRLVDGISIGRWSVIKIKPNSTCKVAVRSVNGNKYSAWKTVTVKTNHTSYENEVITKDGESLTMKIGGDSLTITIGKQIAFPVPKSERGVIESKGITFIPSEIDHTVEYYKDGSAYEYMTARGNTADGLNAYWGIDIDKGVIERVSYGMYHPTFNNDDSKYSFSTNAGWGPNGYRGRTTAVAKDPNVTIVWTLDGTEPKIGQANKTIDASEYPFGQVKVKFEAYNGSVQVRGTSVQGQSSYIWPELTTYFDRCEWIRVYSGNTLVMEDFIRDGF